MLQARQPDAVVVTSATDQGLDVAAAEQFDVGPDVAILQDSPDPPAASVLPSTTTLDHRGSLLQLLDLDEGLLRRICGFLTPTKCGQSFILTCKRTALAVLQYSGVAVFPGAIRVSCSGPDDLLRFLSAPLLFKRYSIHISFSTATSPGWAKIGDYDVPDKRLSEKMAILAGRAESVEVRIDCGLFRGSWNELMDSRKLHCLFQWLRCQRNRGSLMESSVAVDLPDVCDSLSMVASELGDLLGELSNVATLKDVTVHRDLWKSVFQSLHVVRLNPAFSATTTHFNTLQNLGLRGPEQAAAEGGQQRGVATTQADIGEAQSHLRRTELHYRRSFGWTMECLQQFKNLKRVTLCRGFDYPILCLALCKSLEEIDLPQDVPYGKQLDDVLSCLPNLRTLDLSSSASRSAHPDLTQVLSNCRQLRVVRLSYWYNSPVDLTHLTQLREFTAAGRAFNHPLTGVEHCRCLEEVELGASFDQPLDGLASCKRLRKVTVGAFFSRSLRPLHQCPTLLDLFVAEEVIEWTDVSDIAGFPAGVVKVVAREDGMFHQIEDGLFD